MNLRLAATLSLSLASCTDSIVENGDGLPPEVRRYIQARCTRLLSCDCETASFTSSETCTDALTDLYLEVEPTRAINLECFDAIATTWNNTGCDGISSDAPCEPYENSRQEGDSCIPFHFSDYHFTEEDCETGLTCWDGRCVQFQDTPPGDACPESGFCGGRQTCIESICVPLRSEGEQCEEEHDCTSDLNCNEGTCAAATSQGASCDATTECVTPLQCVAGSCIEVERSACYAALL